ncbi:MAG TPA: branched-chain amino acid ABC transporter permease [Pyrinomonadaceae bacterium]|nr:branched-chain amino acid ABC transporter permease [Pyrinomonadaceae bacterium]
MTYVWHILIMISLYTLLSMSLNIVVGYTGLLSLCHAAFYGIGAYATTLLMIELGWGFVPALITAAVLTSLLSLVIAIPSLRFKGDYFVLGTWGFQIIIYSMIYNWMELTRGPFGIGNIPTPNLLGLTINSAWRYFIFSMVISGICALLIWGLCQSPFGRVLKSIREDEIAAESLGKNVLLLKVTAFALGAAFAAIPGGLYAGYTQYIDPTSFTLNESIFILSIVIIGGAGNLLGPLIGAIFMVLLPEVLRSLQIPESVAAGLRQIIYGGILVVLMRFRPQGILGDYRFD